MSEDNDIRTDIAKYLETQGWGVVLVAEHGVKGIDPEGYRYEYFMKFLGKQRENQSSGEKVNGI